MYLVAVHEIGHALGLEHVYEKSSIMYPSYQLLKEKDILSRYDRISIQQIYGSASPTMRTTIKTTTTQTRFITKATLKTTIKTTSIKTPKVTIGVKTSTKSTKTLPTHISYSCRHFIDAAFDFPDNTFHILDTGMFRRYSHARQTWDRWVVPFQQMYHRLPNRISAGTYDFPRNQVLIFTSTHVYQYKIKLVSYKIEYSRNDPLPIHLQGAIVGAIYYQDSVYLIKAKSLQQFDVDNLQRKSNEIKLNKEFSGLSGSVKAAFTSGYLHHFFTDNRLIYIWDEQFNRWKIFGKPMETNWFACNKK